MRTINGVQMKLAPQPADVKKYQVFASGDRWVVGRMVYGAGNVLYDVVDDSRSQAYAEARAEALNTGKVQA